MNFLKNVFGKKKKVKKPVEDEWTKFLESKEKALEKILGKMNDIVGHAIIPFAVGGTVDMYYFSEHIKGTAFVTMELIKPDGSGPVPNTTGTYELIAFTKEEFIKTKDKTAPFNLIERQVCGIFTAIGNYSFQSKLEPGQTCEIPGFKGEPNRYFLFDEYNNAEREFIINGKKHGLLLIIELFKDELEYKRKYGSRKLIQKLKEKNIYPYTDMNRESVLKS